MKNRKKTILGAIFILAILFTATALTTQTDLLSSNESCNEVQSEMFSYLDKGDATNHALKCGEGKCGDGDSDESESSSEESKCGDGKCSDGKDSEKSDSEESKSDDAKCGEGKCGE